MTARKRIFLVVLAVIQLAVIWPVYTFFSGIRPLILGLPLSFAWIGFILIAAFLLLLWYYLSDPDRTSNRQES